MTSLHVCSDRCESPCPNYSGLVLGGVSDLELADENLRRFEEAMAELRESGWRP